MASLPSLFRVNEFAAQAIRRKCLHLEIVFQSSVLPGNLLLTLGRQVQMFRMPSLRLGRNFLRGCLGRHTDSSQGYFFWLVSNLWWHSSKTRVSNIFSLYLLVKQSSFQFFPELVTCQYRWWIGARNDGSQPSSHGILSHLLVMLQFPLPVAAASAAGNY